MGGGLTLAMDSADNPAFDAWTHYSVPLTEGVWHLDQAVLCAVPEPATTALWLGGLGLLARHAVSAAAS